MDPVTLFNRNLTESKSETSKPGSGEATNVGASIQKAGQIFEMDLNAISAQQCVDILSSTVAEMIEHGKERGLDRPQDSTTEESSISTESSSPTPQTVPPKSTPPELILVLPHLNPASDTEYLDIHFKKPKHTQFADLVQQSPDTAQFSKDRLTTLFKKFGLKKHPAITVHEYIARLLKYLKLLPAVLLASAYYIRNLTYDTGLVLTDLNCFRVVMSTVRIACKLLEDLNYSSHVFAKVSGVKVSELCKLETVMLFLLDFELKVDSEKLQLMIGSRTSE